MCREVAFPRYYTNNVIFPGIALSIKELKYLRLDAERIFVLFYFSHCFWYSFFFFLHSTFSFFNLGLKGNFLYLFRNLWQREQAQ